MIQHSPKRVAVSIALVCLALLLVGAAFGAVGAATADTGGVTFDTHDNASTNSTNETNQTNEDVPTQAEKLRVTPDNPDAEYLQIDTQSSDESYNTSGPYATFTLSEPVESARLDQPKAEVTVLGDGSTIRVEYANDAAGEGGSLYTVELFFADGSTHEIDLYAHETDVSLEGAEYAAYSGVIDYLKQAAESAGYESTPEGVQSYVENIEEMAQLFDALFTEHVMMFISLLLAAAQNFVTWVVALAIIAGLAIYFERKHGWVLRLQQYVESRAEIIRETVRQDYEERRNSAAKHPLEDVSEIGPNAARYWREVDIETVDDMVEVACKGIVKTDRNGEIVYEGGDMVFSHHGIDDLLDVDPLTIDQLREETWLSPLILEGRLAATTALSNIEAALLVAEKEYNRGNEVREARRKVAELNARLTGKRQYEDAATSSNAPRPSRDRDFTGTAAGGD